MPAEGSPAEVVLSTAAEGNRMVRMVVPGHKELEVGLMLLRVLRTTEGPGVQLEMKGRMRRAV